MTQTLAQVIAAEAAARALANKDLGALDKAAQKPDQFNGFNETYGPFSETPQEAESGIKRQPPRGNNVQLVAQGMLEEWLAQMTPAVDLALAKDGANCNARADVTVEGEILMRDVPATHLLHMEKVLSDLATFIGHLPVQDPREVWSPQPDGTRATGETFTVRDEVKKVALSLHPGNDKHPPQTAIIEETTPVGRWTKVKYTGALAPERKRELTRRVNALRAAFREALHEANRLAVPDERVSEGAAIARYILE
jgi:hypothetical protein